VAPAILAEAAAQASTRPSGPGLSPGAADTARERRRSQLPPAAPCLGPAEEPPLGLLLDQAVRDFERGRFAQALECAREAGRVDPRSVAAHHFRAAALVELGQLEEARTAYARALALDPDDPEVLRSVAELHVRRLGGRDDLELALLYVGRALPRAQRAKDRVLQRELHLVAAMALDDLGRPGEALEEATRAVELDGKDREARRERAVALFELSRFDLARAELERLAAEAPDAWAEQYLGLVAERAGDDVEAHRHFERARALDPEAFPASVLASPERFTQVVREEALRLPPEAQKGLGLVDFQVQELPEVEDLTATEPPLSPGILGLFRPPPEGLPQRARPAIVLYRRNLARAARTEEELRREVRDTLLHEVGHLNGEDDEQLRDRGL
jgi:tetratricopeptide (TPR) repeat protein